MSKLSQRVRTAVHAQMHELKYDAHFGHVRGNSVDWRRKQAADPDPDDTEMPQTPQDVIEILGFDPKDA